MTSLEGPGGPVVGYPPPEERTEDRIRLSLWGCCCGGGVVGLLLWWWCCGAVVVVSVLFVGFLTSNHAFVSHEGL